MFELFPQLRSGQVNGQCEIVSRRALRICELMHAARVPLRVNKLQDVLLTAGEPWAAERTGYMAIWTELGHLVDAGVVARRGTAGFQLVEDHLLADIFASNIARLLKSSFPNLECLAPLREEVLHMALRFAGKSQKKKTATNVG